jgi:hypothetical protein
MERMVGRTGLATIFGIVAMSVVGWSPRAYAQTTPSWSANATNNTLQPASTGTRVGVGIAAPSAQLDVVSATASRPTLRVNQTAANTNIAEFRFNGSTKVFINSAGVLQADSGVKIKSWSMEVPDYVFDANRYKLTGLDEVDRFIKEQGHLPEIPAAAEMKENGMDLAEMNLRLLKKVEELTLYAIDQDRRIRGLEEKLDGKKHSKASPARAR